MSKANEHLLEEIRKIKSSHPAWGYRRVWAYLRFRKDYKINKKRVYRLMRIHGLTVPKNRKLDSNSFFNNFKAKNLSTQYDMGYGYD